MGFAIPNILVWETLKKTHVRPAFRGWPPRIDICLVNAKKNQSYSEFLFAVFFSERYENTLELWKNQVAGKKQLRV